MIAIVAAMLIANTEPPIVKMLEGRCDYTGAPALTAQEQRTVCDVAVLSEGKDNEVLVQFARKSGGGLTGFVGPIDGKDMTIRRIYLRAGTATVASGGHCRLFFHGDDISGITCVGRIGSKSIVANFRAFAP